jgi:pimeloyl-ACP methyl ester carboxylesterase
MSASKLYYTCASPFDVGKKTAIFLHAAYMSSTMWVDQMTYLKENFPRVNLVCIDVNGHGKTTNGRTSFTLYDQCDDIVGLMVATSFTIPLLTNRTSSPFRTRSLSGCQAAH